MSKLKPSTDVKALQKAYKTLEKEKSRLLRQVGDAMLTSIENNKQMLEDKAVIQRQNVELQQRDARIQSLQDEIAKRNSCKLVTAIASSNHILSLPTTALAIVFTEFLSLDDVCRFDSAVTNHEDRLRSVYLQLIGDFVVVFRQKNVESSNASYCLHSGQILNWMHLRKMHMRILTVRANTKKNRSTELPVGIEELTLDFPTNAFLRHVIDHSSRSLRKLVINGTALKLADLKKLVDTARKLEELVFRCEEKENSHLMYFMFAYSTARLAESLKKLSIAGFRFLDRSKVYSYTFLATVFYSVEVLTLEHVYGEDVALESTLKTIFPLVKTLIITGYSHLSLECMQRLAASGVFVTKRIPLIAADDEPQFRIKRADAERIYDALPAHTWYAEEEPFMASMGDLFPTLSVQHLRAYFATSSNSSHFGPHLPPNQRGLLCQNLLMRNKPDVSDYDIQVWRASVLTSDALHSIREQQTRALQEVYDHINDDNSDHYDDSDNSDYYFG